MDGIWASQLPHGNKSESKKNISMVKHFIPTPVRTLTSYKQKLDISDTS
jgi:hypothetical protein